MKRQKSYLLFLLGEFTINSEVLSDLVNTLTFVIGSPYLKYVHHDNLIITHFESYDTLEDIDFYLNTTLDDSILSYFLLPKPRKMGMRLDDGLKKHLTDLKSNNLKTGNSTEQISENFIHINEVLHDYTQKFIKKVKEKSEDKDYQLDDVLDKITESGIDSLTSEEKKFLNNISKD